MCTDVWTYISMGYFAQVRGHGTVGCSTMPHKVNPIRFENAEANLEVSNALFDVLAATLVQSRLQRDLTDSSMQRNIGSAFGHSLLAIDNATRGLDGLDAVPAAMAADLDANWEVLGEPVQSAMRALGARGVPGMEEPYERLKELTRGRRIGQAELVEFVRGLGLPADVEERLAAMTPRPTSGSPPSSSTTCGDRLDPLRPTSATPASGCCSPSTSPRWSRPHRPRAATRSPSSSSVPGVRLWVAESGAALLGSVALQDLVPGHVEIKTMRVTASARGTGRRCSTTPSSRRRRSGAGSASRPECSPSSTRLAPCTPGSASRRARRSAPTDPTGTASS